MSVALPLPSSPHWAPTSTMAGIGVLPDIDEAPAQAATGALAIRAYPPDGHQENGRSRSGGENLNGRRAAVPQERPAAVGLLLVADRGGRAGERVQRTQEAAVGLVLPRDRAVALPSGAAQLVEPAVVAGTGVGVGLEDIAGPERAVGEFRPCRGVARESGCHRERVNAGLESLAGLRVVRQLGRGWPSEEVLLLHVLILPNRRPISYSTDRTNWSEPIRWAARSAPAHRRTGRQTSFLPEDRRFSHACARRAAMPASADLPRARGAGGGGGPAAPAAGGTPAGGVN